MRRSDLFVWETGLLQNLVGRLEGVGLGEGRDEWCWRPEEGGGFSVNSCYKLVERLFLIDDNIPEGDECVLNVKASKNCVLCGRVEETALHLFLHCEVVLKVLHLFLHWLQFNFLIPHNLFAHFECWYYEATFRRIRWGFS